MISLFSYLNNLIWEKIIAMLLEFFWCIVCCICCICALTEIAYLNTIVYVYIYSPFIVGFCLLTCTKKVRTLKIYTFSYLYLSLLFSLLFLYSLDFKISYTTSLFIKNFFIKTPFISFYCFFNINCLSLIFVILTTFILLNCLLWSVNLNFFTKPLFLFFLLMDFLLKGCFFSYDIFTFFIFFESLLLSIFFFIGVLGLHKRKVKAIYLLYVYTLLGSFLLLLGVLIITSELGNSNLYTISQSNLTFSKQLILGPLMCISFLIKIPAFPFHLWLPEAHVEASTLGSVLLASILLKLGGYGILKFILPLFPYASLYYTPLIESISCLGFFYSSISALRQSDFKKIIAYSSVVHMHLVLFSLFSFNLTGLIGSVILMVSHGLTSAGIFFCLGSIYDRFLTRNVFYISNLASTMPLFTVSLFIFILSNISFPGTLNFISEIICLIGVFTTFKSLNFIFIFLGLVFNTYYNFWFFNKISFGVSKNNSYNKFYTHLKYRFFLIGPSFQPLFNRNYTSLSLTDFIDLRPWKNIWYIAYYIETLTPKNNFDYQIKIKISYWGPQVHHFQTPSTKKNLLDWYFIAESYPTIVSLCNTRNASESYIMIKSLDYLWSNLVPKKFMQPIINSDSSNSEFGVFKYLIFSILIFGIYPNSIINSIEIYFIFLKISILT